jgi:putative MATE family efflux protein
MSEINPYQSPKSSDLAAERIRFAGGKDRSVLLAEGKIPRLVLMFSLPAVIGMLAQAMYYLVDRAYIGHGMGESGIAGVTIAFPAMLVLLACGMLIGLGAAALVSIRMGQKRKADAEAVLGNAVVLLVAVAALLTVGGLLGLDYIVRCFGAIDIDSAVFHNARDYLQIIVAGAGFQVIGFGLNAIIRGEGNPRVAMYTLLIGVLLNCGLAPIFIFGLHWGMRGAALATVISQAVSATWAVWHFLSGNSVLTLHLRNLRLRPPVCAAIMAVGSPQFLMQMAAGMMNVILNNQLRIYGGDVAIATWGAVYIVGMMVALPIIGINQGVQPIIGFNYGAEKFDRVKKALQIGVLAATSIVVFGFLIAMLIPGPLIRLFGCHSEEMVTLGTHAMRISLLMLPLVGFQILSASYFQAVGKPREAMFLMLSRQILLLIPAVWLLPRFFAYMHLLPLDGVWAALPTADLCSSILTGVCFFREIRHLQRRHTENRLVGSPALVAVPSGGGD